MGLTFRAGLLCMGFGFPLWALAHDFGQLGVTFPISEPDLRRVLEVRLQEYVRTHEMVLNQTLSKSVPVGRPLPKAIKPRRWILALPNASHASFTRSLLFIDGTDPSQTAFAKKTLVLKPLTIVILTEGEPARLENILHHPVYVDQGGSLTQHFDIHALPAWVIPSGSHFLIQEEVVP